MLRAHNELNQVLVLHVDREDLSHFVNADHTVGSHVADCDEDQLVSDALAVNQGCARCLVHEKVSQLCDNEK